jgi:hypothetical protein
MSTLIRRKNADVVLDESFGNSWYGCYRTTDESLEAITSGLALEPRDSALTIAGCGDQAFALLGKGCKVCVVDNDPRQLKLVARRASLLRNGDIEEFLNPFGDSIGEAESPQIKARQRYFGTAGRLFAVRANLHNLLVNGEPSNIFEEARRGKYNKIYLSSCFSYGSFSMDFVSRTLQGISRDMPPGLVYISDADKFDFNAVPYSGFEVDSKQSVKAQILQLRPWMPLVLRKN